MRPVGTGLEISLQPKDGTELPADIALSPFATETGSLVVATVRDATERKRAEEGEKAALKERQRLARELHDSVSQVLYGIALGSETARDLLARDPARAREPLEFIHRLAEAGLTEMRALTFELRPESLAQDGLVATLTNQLTAMRARHCINVDKILPIEPVCSLAVKEAVFRIAQEALHNVVKHARRPGSNSISSVTTRGLRSTSATTASASTWGRSFRDISACRPCASGRSAWAVPLTCRPRPVTGPGSALCSATQAEG